MGDLATTEGKSLDMNATMIEHGGSQESLYVGCGFHNMELKDCPCPKGQDKWLEYRALWVAERRKAAEAELRLEVQRAGNVVLKERNEQLQQRADDLGLQLIAAHARRPVLLEVVDQGQYQMVLLALAELELRRPGWNYAIGELVKQLTGKEHEAKGLEMLERFKKTSADQIKSFFDVKDQLRDKGYVSEDPGRYEAFKEAVALLDEVLKLNPLEAKYRGG